ncbi:MAG: metal-dependent transcriptional regulator [Oscillospiraceae bacterium]|nr:metal-dependent transcriptional regulator [Oscillospiraceae bacterium]
MAIHESGEMYLEAILVLKREMPQVRAIDIVNHTGYSKPSVSRALGILKKNDYVVVDEDGYISFTEKGEKHANTIFERHNVLTALLKKIGVSDETSEEDACKMEHVISNETFDAIKNFLNI